MIWINTLQKQSSGGFCTNIRFYRTFVSSDTVFSAMAFDSLYSFSHNQFLSAALILNVFALYDAAVPRTLDQ